MNNTGKNLNRSKVLNAMYGHLNGLEASWRLTEGEEADGY
jgi:hypothetical protein